MASEDTEFFTLIRLPSFTQIASDHWIFINFFFLLLKYYLKQLLKPPVKNQELQLIKGHTNFYWSYNWDSPATDES